MLWTSKGKFHAQNQSLNGGFEVLVPECAQNGGFQEPWLMQLKEA